MCLLLLLVLVVAVAVAAAPAVAAVRPHELAFSLRLLFSVLLPSY